VPGSHAPALDRIFEIKNGPLSFAFRDTGKDLLDHEHLAADNPKLRSLGFLERMKLMVGFSDNGAAANCIRDIGFWYIASVLLQSGIYDPTRGGGLWLGSDYGAKCLKLVGEPGKRRCVDRVWQAWRGALAGGGYLSATPASLVSFMLLLKQGRIVSADGCRRMLELLDKDAMPGRRTRSPFEEGLEKAFGAGSTIAFSKLGLTNVWSDVAYLERTAGGKTLRYVAAGLGGRKIEEMWKLIEALDGCIRQVNGVP
jgi:hypothetical protein